MRSRIEAEETAIANGFAEAVAAPRGEGGNREAEPAAKRARRAGSSAGATKGGGKNNWGDKVAREEPGVLCEETGIRMVRMSNGVACNYKHTAFDAGQVACPARKRARVKGCEFRDNTSARGCAAFLTPAGAAGLCAHQLACGRDRGGRRGRRRRRRDVHQPRHPHGLGARGTLRAGAAHFTPPPPPPSPCARSEMREMCFACFGRDRAAGTPAPKALR